MSVVLKYQDPAWIYGNASNYVWSIRFRMNSAYDPDPHVLSGGSMAYFSEYAALYTRYRVIRFSYSVTAINNTDTPVKFTVAPSKEDLGDNYTNMEELSEVYKGRSALLGQNGSMNRSTISDTIDMATYAGFPGYKTDDTTSARVDTNPSVLFYLNIGINSANAQTGTSFGVRSVFTYHVVFFEPRSEPASLSLKRVQRQAGSSLTFDQER